MAMTLLVVVHLATLGRGDRRARVRGDTEVSVADRVRSADSRIACASRSLVEVKRDAAGRAHDQHSSLSVLHRRGKSAVWVVRGPPRDCDF
jgi:hypothetical protein